VFYTFTVRFATGVEITKHSKFIHDYYNHISDGSAIHITVDTTLQNGRMDINSYIGYVNILILQACQDNFVLAGHVELFLDNV